MKAAILVFSFLFVAGMIPFGLASLPQVLLPSGVTLAVPAGTKLHLGDKWVYPQTVDMTLTEWNVSSWINYTVLGAGSQQVYYGSKPVAVYIDGSHHAEGDGWTYGSSTATVSVALSTVALEYATTVSAPFTPILPQTDSNPQIVHFIVTMQDKPVEGCQIRVYDNATNEYLQNVITGASGKVDVQLQAGTYSYEAEYMDKHLKDSWLHIEEETIRITFSPFSTEGKGTVDSGRTRVLQVAVGAIVIVAAVFALFIFKKRLVG